MNDADEVIQLLKSRFGVETDSALALRLKVSRSTIANWRNRKSVPSLYRRIADGEDDTFMFGGEMTDIERAAMRLAVLRLVRDFGDIADDYRAFLTKSRQASASVHFYYTKAVQDLMNEMSARGSESPTECVALLAYNEVFSGDSEKPLLPQKVPQSVADLIKTMGYKQDDV
ncbi:helix-turn-helix domain containing protein [Marivita sp. S6314]|uniref:helix-turn-helix domain-containing protein n=1 Tax=Marivita sp. S6314 TaxID=2926406 RepID=UPI001FF1EF0D|nr:helix-turn-helix domain-containing protein [Marivita sp. S6314]MCK0150432.1 helix-turn-helix domain containing protein [Marivita sp. S6314]